MESSNTEQTPPPRIVFPTGERRRTRDPRPRRYRQDASRREQRVEHKNHAQKADNAEPDSDIGQPSRCLLLDAGTAPSQLSRDSNQPDSGERESKTPGQVIADKCAAVDDVGVPLRRVEDDVYPPWVQHGQRAVNHPKGRHQIGLGSRPVPGQCSIAPAVSTASPSCERSPHRAGRRARAATGITAETRLSHNGDGTWGVQVGFDSKSPQNRRSAACRVSGGGLVH